jgi:hypothetical protein
MNIYLPDVIEKSAIDTTKVLANIFAGSVKSKVEMSIDNGNWIKMDTIHTIDPEILRMHNLSPFLNEKVKDQPLDDVFGFNMDYPSISHHIWQARLPDGINAGTHKVTIRTTDMYNQTSVVHRVFRIK